MLYLDSPLTVRGLHVFRDYNDKSKFYYMPNSPRLTTEAGQPMFQLLTYRDLGASGVRGGGFLIMTTDLGVPEARRREAEQELAAKFGVQATLTPVPVKSGSVRVSILDSAAAAGEGAQAREFRFVENIVANASPSLYGDQRAAFTAELSRQGAVLMKAALMGQGATPVVVVYELTYVGLLPAYSVKITIDTRRSYEYLRTRMQQNTLWFKSDIDSELEQLRLNQSIKIEEVVFEVNPTEDTATRQNRLNQLLKDLTQGVFFKPALNPGAVLATDRGALQAYDSTTDMTAITAGLTSTSRAALTGVGAPEDAGAPRRPGAAVATGAVETGGVATQPAPAAPATPAQPGPPTAVEAWNRAGRPQGAYLRKELRQDEMQMISYELRQVTAVERTIAPQGQIRMLEGAANLRGRILDVDLNAEFFQTFEGTVTTSADLAAMGVTSAVVKLRYGKKPDGSKWLFTDEVKLTAPNDTKTYRTFVDSHGSRDFEYQVVLTNKPDSAIGFNAATEESPWIQTTTRNLDINPLRFSSVMRVNLVAAMVDWTTVKEIQAKIRYDDQPSGIAAADTKRLTREASTALVPIRPKNAAIRDVTVEAKFFYADNTTESVTYKHDGGEPFVINQPPDSATIVDLTLADVVDRYKRVSVQLGRPGTPPQVVKTVTLSPETAMDRWSFRRQRPDDIEFAYRTTAFLKDGAIVEGEWTTTKNPLVVVGDRAAGVLNVKVMLLGTLAEAGMRTAKVELDYPDAPAWADSHHEQLIQGATVEFPWRVPMARAGATSYQYKVTWFKTDGSRVTSGPHTTKDEILLLDPLAP
jgi:hypothetical protein